MGGYDNYSASARRALDLAEQHAPEFRHSYLGNEHLLNLPATDDLQLALTTAKARAAQRGRNALIDTDETTPSPSSPVTVAAPPSTR